MRKILLSAFVILSFISYVFYIRAKGVTQTPVITPATVGKRVSLTPTDTPIPPTPTPISQLTRPDTVEPTTPPPVIPTATPQPQLSSQYKDGTYTGSVADAFYGNIQVQV